MRPLERLEPRWLLTLDPSFGGDGIATIDLGEFTTMQTHDLSVASDGSTVAVGESSRLVGEPANLIAAIGVVRLDPDGTPDPRFAPDGFLADAPGGMNVATAVESVDVPGEGTSRIFVAGVRRGLGGEPDRAVVSKYTRFGKQDRTFDAARRRGSVLVPQLASVGDLHVLPDGSILLAGTAQNRDATIVRLGRNGRIDTTFGQDGLTPTITERTGITRTAGALAVDSAGRILLGVTASNSTNGADDVIVRRFTPNGAFDANFGTDGTVNVAALTDAQQLGDETLRGLAVDPSDRAYVYYGRASGDDMRLARFLASGQLDAAFFGTSGIAVMPDHFTTGVFDFAPERMSAIREVTRFEGPREFSLVVGGATDRNGPLVPGVVGISTDGTVGTFGFFGVAEMEGVTDAHAIVAPSPGGMLVSVAIPADPNASTRQISAGRFFPDARPSAILNVKPVALGSTSAQFWVTYRSPTGIDTGTIDNRDLHITMPDGFVRSARAVKIEPHDDDDHAVTARYKIASPGGTWDPTDNGDYTIRLRSRDDGVRTPANDIFAIGQFLGVLTVDL